MLRDIYSELNDSHSLSDMPRRAIPAALATLKELLPEAKWCAPQLSGPAAQIRTQFHLDHRLEHLFALAKKVFVVTEDLV